MSFKNVLVTGLVAAVSFCGCSICSADLSQDIRNQAVEASLELGMLLKRGVPSADIDVHVNGKLIQLAGFVDTKEQYLQVKQVTAKYEDKYKMALVSGKD